MDFCKVMLKSFRKTLHSRSLCYNRLLLQWHYPVSLHSASYWTLNAPHRSKSTEAKYWPQVIMCNNQVTKLQVHLAQILNNDALQKPNPGADECAHTPKFRSNLYFCMHMQYRQGLKLIVVSGFITYALPYQMSFVLPSLHLSPQMSSHVMEHMGLSWHCLQTGRAFGKRKRT